MSFNTGDVEVGSFTLNGIDVRARLQNFSVFENILKPYVALTGTIIDSTDMLNRLLTSTDVELNLSFNQPGQEPYRAKMAVTSIEKGRSLQNMRTASYTLTAYSRHMLKFPRVQKAFRELPATDIASTLINEFLGPDKPLNIRDISRGVLGNQHMPYNLNGVQIHKAIRSVLERAASSVNLSSAYVFFENNRGMIIDTLENMLGRGPVATYFQRPMGKDFLLDQYLQNFVILALKEESRTDRTDRVQAEKQESNVFDLFSHDNVRQLIGDGLPSTIMNIARNALRPPTHMEKVLPARKKIATDFDSQSVTIKVPLNTELTVGEGVGIDVISPLGDTRTAVRDKVSGTHLVTECRHDIDFTGAKMMSTTTVKGTRAGRLG